MVQIREGGGFCGCGPAGAASLATHLQSLAIAPLRKSLFRHARAKTMIEMQMSSWEGKVGLRSLSENAKRMESWNLKLRYNPETKKEKSGFEPHGNLDSRC
eukprot:6463723-Amphidinium_carterae.1